MNEQRPETRIFKLLLTLLTLFSLSGAGCGIPEDVQIFLSDGLHPPVITAVYMESTTRIVIESNNPVESAALQVLPEITVAESGIEDSTVWFELSTPTQTGKQYTLVTVLTSPHGHSSQMMQIISGFNQNPARLVFNEIIVRGSGNNPDCIEFLVTGSGNLGGTTWYLGTSEIHDAVYHFPAIEVEEGDFIILHVRPEGIAAEIDELGDDLALSGGLLSHPAARDLWLPEPTGLPSNNGVLTLYAGSEEAPMDAFLYSNRTSESDEQYHGFGTSKMLAWVESIAAQQAWPVTGNSIRPEDTVSPEYSTGTRSLNRSVPLTTGNGRYDWHIVPTRGATIGEQNSNDIFNP